MPRTRHNYSLLHFFFNVTKTLKKYYHAFSLICNDHLQLELNQTSLAASNVLTVIYVQIIMILTNIILVYIILAEITSLTADANGRTQL